MKKRFTLFLTFIISAAFALSGAAFADNSTYSSALDDIFSYELKRNGYSQIQEWIDGSITDNAGQSSEWYAIALSGYGDYDLSGYSAALEKYMTENKIPSSTARMKNVLALLSTGRKPPICDYIAEDSVAENGIMSIIYGLHILNNGCICSRYTVESLTDELISMQFQDGGWAIMGSNGDIDVTAMSVQALAMQYVKNEKVRDSVERALAFLSEKQKDDGGYTSFGTANPESASQVLIAVSSVGLDINDPRFVKNGHTLIDGIMKYRLEDGSFSHTEGSDSNETATIQAALAFTAYSLSHKGELLYDFPISEQEEKISSSETSKPAETSPPETKPVSKATTAVSTLPDFPDPDTSENRSDYKPIAYSITGGLAIIACVVLVILKKTRLSNFVAVCIIAGTAALFIFLTDFRSSEEYYRGSAVHKDNPIGTVTMTIRCDTIKDISDSPYVPKNGIILDTTEFEITEGETVYNILTQAAKQFGIQLQANGDYIAGIAYLYEFDYGDLSGWIYHVNGESPFVMCSDYKLHDGDVIEWLYTLELGNDLPVKSGSLPSMAG